MCSISTVIEIKKEDYVLGIKDAYPSATFYATPLQTKVGTYMHTL